MLRSLISLSNDLGLRTVAGGLETGEEVVAQKTLRYYSRAFHRHAATARSENGE